MTFFCSAHPQPLSNGFKLALRNAAPFKLPFKDFKEALHLVLPSVIFLLPPTDRGALQLPCYECECVHKGRCSQEGGQQLDDYKLQVLRLIKDEMREMKQEESEHQDSLRTLSQDCLFYIKNIMDQMEEAKSDAVTDVKHEMEQKREKDDEDKLKLKEERDRFKKDLEESKGDTRHYRKKVDTLKQELAKAEAELAKVEAKAAAELKETKASLEQHIAAWDKLVEAKVKLEVKLDIQKRDNEELKVFTFQYFRISQYNIS